MRRTYNSGVDACMTIIEKKMDNLTQKERHVYNDVPSGRTEVIEKGDWMGSHYEFELFTELLNKFRALRK